MNSNFTFNYSVSTTQWDRNKDEKNTRKLKWREKRGAIKDLIDAIQNNHAFCPCFYHEGDTFSNKDKSDRNLKSTNLIALDFDAVRLTAREFYAQMECTEIPPSIVYTTANNGKYKSGKNEKYNNRYRVIYVLNAPIYNATFYKQIHQTLKSEICSTIDDLSVYNDNSDSSVSHFFAGNKNAEIYSSDSVISLEWLCERYDIKTANEPNKLNEGGQGGHIISQADNTNKHGNYIQYLFNQWINKLKNDGQGGHIIKKGREHYISTLATLGDSPFINDYYNLSVNEIIEKYISVYPSIEVSRVEYDTTQAYYMVPKEYMEIKRRWHFEEVEKSNGDTYKVTQIERCKNGQGRRRRLFLNLIIRRLITPSISFEHLLFNCVYELHHYIDNSDKDDIITKKDIATIAVNAYFADVDKWQKLKDYHKPKWKVNKAYCTANGITPRHQAGKVRAMLNKQAKEVRWQQIDKYYNQALTNDANLELLISNGINVSLTQLKAYKRERGYSKRKKSKQIASNNNATIGDSGTAKAPTNKAIEGNNNSNMEQQPTATINEPNRAVESGDKCAMAQQNTTTTSESNRAIESDDNKAMEQQPTTTINGSHIASNEVTSGDVLTMEIVKAVVNELDAYYSDGTVIKEVEPNRYEVNLSNAILYPELADKVYNYLYGHGLNAGKLYIDRDDDDKCCKKFSMWLG